MKEKNYEEWIKLISKDNKKRYYKYFIAIPIVTGLLTGVGVYFKISINENQFYWILGSIVQGFAAFFGVAIAIIISRPLILGYKGVIKEIKTIYSSALLRSSFTIFYALFGMITYSNLTNTGRLAVVILASLTAFWSVLEIFNLTWVYLAEKSLK